jgi:hypothetical protein
MVMRPETLAEPVYGFAGHHRPIRLPSIATSPDFGRMSLVAWMTGQAQEAMEAAEAAVVGLRGAGMLTLPRLSSADRLGCDLPKDDAPSMALAPANQTDRDLRGVVQVTSRDAGTAVLADDESPDYEGLALAEAGGSDGSA